jgi:hypothetical protein
MGYPSTVDAGGVAPLIIEPNELLAAASLTTTLATNTVYLWAFEVSATTVVTGIKYRMGATVTGTANMGIYAFNGSSSSLITGSDTGAHTNAASQDNSVTYGTAITLSPGQYLMALAPSNNTDTYFARTVGGTTLASRIRLATNALSAGALPPTTGALTTSSIGPICSLTIQGGL